MTNDLPRPGEEPMDWAYRTGRVGRRSYELVTGKKPGAVSVAASAAVPQGPTLDEATREQLVMAAAGPSGGLLPAFCASGIDPEELRAVPGGAWVAIASEPDPEVARAMIAELSGVSKTVMASARTDRVAAMDDDQMMDLMFGPGGPRSEQAKLAEQHAKFLRTGGML